MPHTPEQLTDQGERDRREQWITACLRHQFLDHTSRRGLDLAGHLRELVERGFITSYATPEQRRG
jgi:hypothetical protein